MESSTYFTVYFFALSLTLSHQKTTLLQSVKDLLIESDQEAFIQSRPENILEEYDFIVVGGGTAGCTVATRLSEISQWEILLLEAGRPEELYMDIPVLVGSLQLTDIDWQYKYEPSNSYCLGYPDHQCRVPRGKVLGGSSILNYMIATRGNKKDYDRWEELGNPGWGYEDVLPYFLKAENITIDNLKNNEYHSTKGPLSVSHLSYHSALGRAYLEAGSELGHRVGDYNGASQTVFSYFQFTQNRGRRASNSRSYFLPAYKTRKNLHLKLESTVVKILMEGDEAKGVQYVNNGKTYEVRARKEVVVTSGAINSPQLLMLSGIGPKDHLEKLGINVIKDLKVGYNFQDHVSLAGIMFVTNVTDRDLQPDCIGNDPKFMVEYIEEGGGPWQVPGGNEAVFFYNFDAPNDPNAVPHLELHFSSESPLPEERVRGYNSEVYKAVFEPVENNITWLVQPILLKPKSRGRIMLKNADPFEKPAIVPNYFEVKEDLTYILKGIRKIMEIAKTKSFQRYDSRLNDNPVPGCKNYRFGSDQYWECAIRQLTITNYHQSGTCKMGPASDPDAVVDSRLKVHGISKLRVIDASIMPELVAAHTNIPTNMIAEKGADYIKEDHKYDA